MRLGLTFFCLCLLLVSCGEKVIEPPKDLITKDKMASIMYDLAILNSTKGTNPSILKNNNIEFMPFIFEKYNIDSLQFVESDVYYASIPLQYQTIYEEVESRLEKEVKLLAEEKKHKEDSIKKASQLPKDSLKKSIKLQTKDSLSKK